MNMIIFIGFSQCIWLLNIMQGTGLGTQFNVTDRTHYLWFAICGVIVLLNCRKYLMTRIKYTDMALFISIFLSFVCVPYIFQGKEDGMQYLLIFLLVFIVSKFSLNDKDIQITVFFYAILGIIFLSFYNFTTILDGWNSNSIAMIGFFSYILFYMGFMDTKDAKERNFVLIVLVIYMLLLEAANSRGSVLFCMITLLMILKVVDMQQILSKKYVITVLLLIPLLISVLVVNVSGTQLYEILNNWSLDTFSKPIFNGRDTLWASGFDVFFNYPLFGTGSLSFNAHNTAVVALYAFGGVGFIAYIALLRRLISVATPYLHDTYVCQGITGFLIIYLQQSIELGFLAEAPHFLPYMILGIVFGRIKYLKKVTSCQKSVSSSPSITPGNISKNA